MIGPASTLAIYTLAAVCEIAGCFGMWLWVREGRSPLWAVAGTVSLITFAWLLTRVPLNAAGRTFAAYGGIYIVASLAWLPLVERVAPTRSDLLGGAVGLLGTFIILLGSRSGT